MSLSHIFQNYQLPAYSVFIRDCLYTHHVNRVTRIIPAEPRFSREPTWCQHGSPGRSHLPGRPRTTMDVLNFPKRPCWHPIPHGPSRTFPDKQGPLRTLTAATRFMHQINPDVIRVDPAPIWDWGFRCWKTTLMD